MYSTKEYVSVSLDKLTITEAKACKLLAASGYEVGFLTKNATTQIVGLKNRISTVGVLTLLIAAGDTYTTGIAVCDEDFFLRAGNTRYI